MKLPPRVKFKGILKQGHAFKAMLGADIYPRYYFILNTDPETHAALVLSTSTTDFLSHESCEGGDDVHIVLGPSDYDEFEENCLICCDRPQKVAKTKLEAELKKQKYELLKPLPADVLTRILEGITKSPVVTWDIKKLALG